LPKLEIGDTSPLKQALKINSDSSKSLNYDNLKLTKFQSYLHSHRIEKESEETVKQFIVKCVLNNGKLSKSRPPDTSRPSLKNSESALNYITADKYNIFDVGNPVEESLQPG